jgi:hypothetical protein
LVATDRFKQDLFTLGEILKLEFPPEVVVRSNAVLQVLYGYGDASGKGFGSTMLSNKGIRFRIGLWEKDAEDESSNWKEFENVVEALEEEGKNGSLGGTLVYFFTDNSTVEAALYKGNLVEPKTLQPHRAFQETGDSSPGTVFSVPRLRKAHDKARIQCRVKGSDG